MTRNLSATILLGCLCAGSAAGQRVHDVVQRRPVPAGAAAASDVIMRSLTLRTGRGEDGHDTFRALADFHVTRLEWAYIGDPGFIDRVRQSGRLFGGAASSALSHIAATGNDTDYASLACVNLDGQPVIPTWKRTWKPPGNLWMCVNNPELERCYLDYLYSCLDAGAQVMQRDEPGGNVHAVSWGGCFCDHCMRAFREYLSQKTTAEQRTQLAVGDVATFDYRQRLRRQGAPSGDAFRTWDGGELKQLFEQFQAEATRVFHRRTRAALNAYAGRRVPFSCNNGCRRWTPIELEFDWCFGELAYSHATPAFIHDAIREAADRDRAQVVTMPKKRDRDNLEAWHRLTRRTIAMAYACGGHCMVPWDVYMPGDAPRYFGTPDQYADLFGFIRASAGYLDDYEYAGAFGPGFDCQLYGDRPPLQLTAAGSAVAVVRAVPGHADGAIIVHLVDWSDDPRPVKMTWNPDALFGNRPLKIRLLTPAPYDAAEHERAEKLGSYEELRRTMNLASGYVTSVTVPALQPWGVLVIEPDLAVAAGLWQPAIWLEHPGLFGKTVRLTAETATPGARVHYTIDGSEPNALSPRARGGIVLEDSATVRAVAILPDGRSSETAAVTLRKLDEAAGGTCAPSSGLGDGLRLWLDADMLELEDGDPVRSWPAGVGPDAVAGPHKTLGGTVTGPPAYVADAIGGLPAVRFDGVDDSLVVPDFANRFLAESALTVFMVTRSDSDRFGICGNGIWGGGGVPRLYLQRGHFCYGELQPAVNLPHVASKSAISVFMHDGDQSITAATNGVSSEPVSGLPVVNAFGSGGNLALPFWSGNENQAGEIAEILVFDRQLSDRQRAAVEAYLADKYAIRTIQRWEHADVAP